MRKLLSFIILCSCLPAYGQGYRLAQKHYEEGLALHRTGRYEEALRELNRSLYLDAASASTYLLRADVWERLGRPDNALTDVESALLLEPASRELAFRKGLLLFQLARWNDAYHAFSQVLSLPAGETGTVYYTQLPYREGTTGLLTAQSDIRGVVYRYLALSALELKNCRDAIKWLDSALHVQPFSTDLKVSRSRALLECHDTLAARAVLESVLAAEPDNALALYQMARLDSGTISMERRLSEAIRADSLMPDFWLERANIRMQSKDYAGAELDYSRALRFLFANPEIWLNRGMARAYLKNYAGAYDDLTQALRIQEDFVKAWMERGNVLFQMKRYLEATEDYTVALLYDPNYANAYFNRGMCWIKLGKWDNACRDFSYARQFNMTTPEHISKRCRTSEN